MSGLARAHAASHLAKREREQVSRLTVAQAPAPLSDSPPGSSRSTITQALRLGPGNSIGQQSAPADSCRL